MTENITLEQTLTFRLHTCGACGIVYAMEVGFYARKLADKTSFWCPNGHGRAFTGKSEGQQLKEAEAQAEHLRNALTHTQDQLEATERSRTAYKGQVTKIKRRVGKGVCPCCNRYFRELGDHMTTEHPDYAESGPTK